MVANLHALGQGGDVRGLVSKASHEEHELVLCRGDPGPPRRVFRESEEPAQGVSKAGKAIVIPIRGSGSWRHEEQLYRGTIFNRRTGEPVNPVFDAGGFFARLRRAGSSVLLTDYDGTLAPFVNDRHRATFYPGAFEALSAVADGGRTRVVVVSGRPLRELAPVFDLRFELWASHGVETRRRDGSVERPELDPALTRLLEEAERWAGQRGWAELVERKPFGLALHARADPAKFPDAAPAWMARWSQPAQDAGLEVQLFDGGVEFRPAGRHKGQIVERILAEAGDGTVIAYLGDDDTDEDAFRALRGRGLGVLVRWERRGTFAEAWLRPPDELVEFLLQWRTCGAGRPVER